MAKQAKDKNSEMEENENEAGAVVAKETAQVKAEVSVLEEVNLATMQNGLCVVRDLRVENAGGEAIKEVVCSIWSDEGFILPWELELDELGPGERIERGEVEVLLNQRRVFEVAGEDGKSGTVAMTVKAGGKVLAEQRYPMTVLAPSRWVGMASNPELIAAYVMASDEFAARIQSEAAEQIENATGRGALDGYHGGKKRVREICAAIGEAAKRLGVRATKSTDGGLERAGLRLRTPGEIEREKRCTTIDAALLTAAVMERCGLHPVLVVVKGDCLVACHLIDTLFDDAVVKNCRNVRKRIELDELFIVGDGAGLPEDDGDFICAVDVLRCRDIGVNALRLSTESFVRLDSAAGAVAAQPAPSGPQSRIERWTQKLLDFSARNRLLNIPRASRQVIRLMCPDVAGLEDKIAANKAVTIRSIADVLGEKALDNIASGRMTLEMCRKEVDAELEHQRLCVAMPPRETVRRLSDLMHDARTDLEESGVNTLFLTIGELQWLEPGVGPSRKAYRAPILMVPVRLERVSMSEGVKMYRIDDDTTVNATLLEFMRSQFGISISGIDPLPLDESGVDVHQVLQQFRQGVEGLHGWEVFEEATIGCFSFGKFVMWKDMTERAEELKRNALVNHLIGGGGNFDDGVEVFPAAEIAGNIAPGELFCPVSYDSSQLAAVLYSEKGKTFVLHGPPGTGKSQTITNIIAHNLAKGRRVLFVSEKKAALDVVKDRLDRIGLTPFCLELHSNKTEKSRFYAQLKAALDVPETSSPEEWDRTIADFMKCSAELEGYVKALHRTYPNGLSAYNCFSSAMCCAEDTASRAHPELIAINCIAQARDDYRDARQAVQNLIDDFRTVSDSAIDAIPRLKTDAWTPEVERGLSDGATKLAGASHALAAALEPVCTALKIPVPEGEPTALMNVLSSMKDARRAGKRFFEGERQNQAPLLQELLDIRARHEKCSSSLSAYRLEKLHELDFDGIARRLAENAAKFFVIRFFADRALTKELSGILRTGAQPLTAAKLSQDLPAMRELVSLEREYLEKAGEAIGDVMDVPEGFRNASADALTKWNDFKAALDAFAEFADDGVRSLSPSRLADVCAGTLENISELRNVMRYRKAAQCAQSLGVGAFAAYIATNDDGNLDILRVFDDAYAAKMLSEILAVTPELAEFSGLSHDGCIARFRELDARCTELSRKTVFARLAASLPRRRSGPCPEGSELGMIKRECEKKSRQKAVRQLLAESKTLVPALKPCFLMSPLSVAQYLPVDAAPFDLIVFDEASQIPVWDAIGVIARGKQLIVVGDPKQMPPTNFFQKGDAEEAEEEGSAIADQESILDECLVAGVFSTYLNWHYRSRHESLIAFSNEHYYSNRLCTFPAASASPRLGVKFVFVPDGRFARTGKGPRVNEIEAKALVDYICEEVMKPCYKRRSIGIVTFSMPQQKLIRTMLEDRRAADAKLEAILPEEGEGAFFVKNLENVQGDESDVILFSVGYAPDEEDRFTMNFGPLNLTGGERRLNVAITRAKQQIVVFSSIHASQIDAGEDGRTKAVGVGHLKAFLDYAEKAGDYRSDAAAESTSAQNQAQPNTPASFSDVVAKFLVDNGYEVDRAVGCSEHRVDIAVRKPDASGKNDLTAAAYLAGIECDGPSYARQRTVQDRDVNRAGVLRGLGWNIVRVWSVDWALDRARAERRLLDALAAAQIAQIAPTASSTAPEAKDERSEVVPPHAPASTENVDAQRAETNPRPASTADEYVLWKCTTKQKCDAFYEAKSRPKIAKMMVSVVEAEGPIFENTLKKRIARAWGLTRITENAQKVMDACIPAEFPVTEHETGKVFWPKAVASDEFTRFRVPSKSDAATKRTLDEIPPEELRNAMRLTLDELGECPKDDLYREVIKTFGLSTLTSRARRFLDVAYALIPQ